MAIAEALKEMGYSSKREYLQSLAEEYGVGMDTVIAIYQVLGDSELFDGVVSMVQDAAEMGL